uniref:RING-type domain-containing protein n=1 Tax=Glossina morsitans morsitans TaxID=37546 RepID=A0ABK9NG65_GLOMM
MYLTSFQFMMACAVICSICADAFHSLETVACITCGHIFHDVCIRNWMERSNLCPICRCFYSNIKKVYLNFDANMDGDVRNNDLKIKLQQSENTIKTLREKIEEMDKQYRDLQEEYNLAETNFLNLHKQYTELDENRKNMDMWLTEVHDVPSQTCKKSIELCRNTKLKDVNKCLPKVSSNINLFGNSSAVASTSGVNIMRPNSIFSLSPKETTRANAPCLSFAFPSTSSNSTSDGNHNKQGGSSSDNSFENNSKGIRLGSEKRVGISIINSRFALTSNPNLFDNSSAVASTSGVNIIRPNNISLSPKGTTTASTPNPFNFGALSSLHKQPTNPQIPFGFKNPISTENETHSNNALVSSQSSPYAPIKKTHPTTNAVTPSSTTGITTQSPFANIEKLFTSASSCRSLAKSNLTVLNEPISYVDGHRYSKSEKPTRYYKISDMNKLASIYAGVKLLKSSEKSPFGTPDSTPINNENLSNNIFRFGCSPNSATSDPTLEVKSITNPTTLSNCSTEAASNSTNSATYSNSMSVNGESGPADRMTDAIVTENIVIAPTSDRAVTATSTIDTGIEWPNNAFIFGGEENTKNISENPTASFGSFPFFGQAKDTTGSTLPKAENFTDHLAKPTISSNKLKPPNSYPVKKTIRKLQRNPIQDSKTRFLEASERFQFHYCTSNFPNSIEVSLSSYQVL